MAVGRRGFLKRLAFGGALLPWAGCALRTAAPASTEQPNIVLITADDLGWKDLSSYGNDNVVTPHLDRLAREGAAFSHAFGATSSCSSARATFITGQYPHTHGVTGLAHAHLLRSLAPWRITLPKLLREAGWRTAIEGKWHVAPFFPTSWYGYDERLSGVLPGDMWITDAQKSVDWIRSHAGERFYLELNYMSTHRDDAGDFSFVPGFPVDPEAIRVPAYLALPNWPEIRAGLARFYSQMLHMDAMIGAVVDALDALDLSSRTLVAFVSDNGAPFPGSKMTLYDRGIGTPLLFRWPGRIRGGLVADELVSTVDLAPTLLAAAGLGQPIGIEGVSLLPRLLGGVAHDRQAVFAEMTYHIGYQPMRAVRTRDWKYVRNYSPDPIGLDQLADEEWPHRLVELPNQPWTRPRPPEELYDLREDPHEQRNLVVVGRRPVAVAELAALLDQHMRRSGDPYAGRALPGAITAG